MSLVKKLGLFVAGAILGIGSVVGMEAVRYNINPTAYVIEHPHLLSLKATTEVEDPKKKRTLANSSLYGLFSEEILCVSFSPNEITECFVSYERKSFNIREYLGEERWKIFTSNLPSANYEWKGHGGKI